MKNISRLFAMLLLSSSANAAQQLSFDGHFVATEGNPTANFAVGDSFSGQFTFNPQAPDTQGYKPNIPDMGISPLAYFWNFQKNVQSSISFNGQPAITGTQTIGVALIDNGLVLSPAPTSLTDYIAPGTYDELSIKSFFPSSQLSPNALGSLSLGRLFGITAFFAPDTFILDGVNPPDYQNILARQPLFIGFQTFDFDNAALGTFDHIKASEIASVPLPGAMWLFGSVLTGLALRLRKRG